MGGATGVERQQAQPPLLVGRVGELAALRRAVGRVAGGDPGAVLFTGPAGVGKTRLAREGLALGADAGFTVLSGRAHSLSREVAYAPVVEALGPTLRGTASPQLAALVGDLPQLGVLFSGLGVEAPPPLGDPALERTRLVDGVARLLARLADERPVALMIDDVQAADPATLACLRHLAVNVVDRPILLLLTARSPEPGSGLAEALTADLVGAPWWVERIAVGPLGDGDARALVDAVVGGPLAPELLDRVVARCKGQPLFLESVARAMRAPGGLAEHGGVWHLADDAALLPADVRDQLAATVAQVTDPEGRLLGVLALAGGGLEHDVLVAAAGLAPQVALDALDALYRRGLVAAASDRGAHDLAHDLLRDTVLGAMSPVAAARGHAELLGALVARHADDGRVAEHVLGAGALVAPELAHDRLVAAAARARRIGAAGDAVRYLEAAADAARRGKVDALAGLLEEAGLLRAGLAQGPEAQEAWEAARAEHLRRGDAPGVARTERQLAMLSWSVGDPEAAARHLAAAERALDGLEASPEHAEVLHSRAILATRLGDTAGIRAAAGKLRVLAERLGSPSQSARADLAEAVVDFAATDYVTMAGRIARAVEAAVDTGDPVLLSRAYDQASIGAASQGDAAGLRRHSVASLEVGRKAGAPSMQLWPRARIAFADLLVGEWDAALRGTADVLERTRRLGEGGVMRRGLVSMLGTHAWVLVHRGQLAEAHNCLREARELARPALEADRNVFSVVDAAAGLLALADGDPVQAVRQAHQLADFTSGWFPLLSAAVLGEAHARAGDVAAAREVAARFRAVRSSTTVLPETLAAWVSGLADQADGAAPEALASLLDAAAGFDRLGFPYHAARARLAAAIARPGCSAAAAIEEGKGALEVFERLGAPVDARQARELLRSLGVVPSRGRSRTPTGSSFSARELEVARLVAAGLTNAEVATRLFISPRTVTTHLDRIYARLELSSRVALTRYLADSGLLDDGEGAAGSAR